MIDTPNTWPHERSVLIVEDVVAVRDGLAALLSRHYRVSVASSAEEAEALMDEGLCPRVVLSDYDLPGAGGVEFLQRVKARSPRTVNIMLTGVAELDVAVRSLHEGAVFRFLTKPASYDQLCAALDAAFEASGREMDRDLEAGELRFSCESLRSFNLVLEDRVLSQTDYLRRLHGFAVELNKASTLHGIALLAVETLHATLGGRGVHVQIWDRERVGIEESRGPEMSAEMRCQTLETQDGPVGQLVVDCFDPRGTRLSAMDEDFLISVASSTAVAVRNEMRRVERDEAQYATIVALARLSEQRDNETGQHLDRVSMYCQLIAEAARTEPRYAREIDDTFVADIVASAPLHDIGKVGIPDSILMKPGRLTASEWEIMKTHAQIGAQTLESVIQSGRSQGFLEMGRDIAACHHEKWDGSGYPQGLVGEAIPLSARILAIADVYDALTTARPYKAAWLHREALAYIQEHAGTQFDPGLVAHFSAQEKAADEVRGRLSDGCDPAGVERPDRVLRRA
ncbi:MAG: HD domain-containing protein [Planctomycetes bacterium]|nr:HD domain-containing protein [Planctomycetota bacterium]MCB9903670.1 HD domain-containing protein [Planctomycetota bacterium]